MSRLNWYPVLISQTNLLEIDRPLLRDNTGMDSFVVYICMSGSGILRDNKDNELSIRQGQTVLVPAEVFDR